MKQYGTLFFFLVLRELITCHHINENYASAKDENNDHL